MNDERARLFVALELPGHVREALTRWCSDALREVSGVRPLGVESLHLTLCFLGLRPAREIEAIAAALQGVGWRQKAPLSLAEPLWLPPRQPRVLAVRLSDNAGALAA